jgi:molybdopterin-binding protein
MEKMFSYPKKVSLALAIICIGFTSILSSCMKDPKPVPVGEAKLRYINAAYASPGQTFYIDGKKFGQTLSLYGEASDLLTTVSGTKVLAFVDAATSELTVAVNGNLAINESYSIFLYKNLDKVPSVLGIGDNLTAPNAGKAKVRFIHLNGFLNNSVSIKTSEGTELASAIGFARSSDYYQVDPGTKFIAAGTGVTTNPEINPGILAGKIYTVWLTGGSATELKAYSFTTN